MKKRIMSIALALCLLAVAAMGTIAYFTDTDSATNVMAFGNVEIEQTEWQREFDDEGKFIGFEPFEQNKTLMPAVYDKHSASETKVYFNQDDLNIAEEAWCGMWSESADQYNTIDKIVVVQNTGKNDVYYRTLIAIEDPEDGFAGNSWAGNTDSVVHNYNNNERFKGKNANTYVDDIVVGGVKYNLHEFIYIEKLTPGEMSRPSLLQVMLDKNATQDTINAYGGSLEVLCFTQAVQADGFTADGDTPAAEVALDAAFGDITAENHPWAE